MKSLLCFFLGLAFLPISASAIEHCPPPLHLLSDSDSFVIASSQKLGLAEQALSLKPKKDVPGSVKVGGCVTQYCSKGYKFDKVSCRCVQNNICDTNPCKTSTLPLCKSVDGVNYSCECTATSCGAGKSCEGGVCENCVKGVKCNCPGGQVSDGNGGCYTPNDACNPNPCPAEAPSCSALDETSYSCSCTSTSCPDGKRCSDMACQNCTAGDDCGCSSSGKEADGNGSCRCPGIKVSNGYGGCRCPDGYISDGRGGCEIEDPCANKSCAKAKKCDPDTGDCINCPLGEDCGCFDDDRMSGGKGICIETSCGAGNRVNEETGNCEKCAEKEDCGCFEQGGYADGKGGCKIVCEDWEYWDGAKAKCVPAVGKCGTSADCAVGNYCKEHACVPGCDSDNRCNYGERCNLTTKKCENNCSNNPCTKSKYPNCYNYSKTAYLCECTSSSCGSGYHCERYYNLRSAAYTKNSPDSGVCKPDVCTSDNDCRDNETCVSGVCKAESTLCDSNPCTNSKYPNCYNYNKTTYLCECTFSSCGSGYHCEKYYNLRTAAYTKNSPDSGVCKPDVCTSDNDCRDNETCVSGVCKAESTLCDSNPCTNSKYPNCYNYNKTTYLCECTFSSCGSGYKCEKYYNLESATYTKNSPDSGLCKVVTTESCSTNNDCSAEKKCSGGYCVFRGSCTTNADCASGEHCNSSGNCAIDG